MKTICSTRLHFVRLLVASALAVSALTVPTASAQGAGAITVNDFANYRVFQRDIGGTSKSVTISGTSSNMNWSLVQARVLQHGTVTAVVDWTTIDETPGGGTFSGDLTVPQGGWYDVEIRALDAGGTVLGSSRGTNKWGVGMSILVIGQSNMSGRGQLPFAIATSDLAVNYSNAGRWEHLADPYDDESPPGAVDSDNDVISTNNSGGSMTPGIANSLLSTFDFPIAFVPAAKGGSNLYVNGSNYGWAYRNPSNHFDTSTLYGQSITKAQNVGGVELIIMHQGEADLGDGRTEANYEADFATMIGNYRQDLYSDIPIFICQLGTAGGGTDAGAVGIRNAQHDVDNGTSIFMSATAMDLPRFDTWHYNTPQLTVIGSRMANAIKYYFGQSTYYRGPSINSAFFSDGNRKQVIVSLHHRGGTDIAPATGITGFEVFDNGSSITIQSAARYAADAVRLTLSRSISSGHTVTLRYLYGRTPNVSGLVKDDSPLALPLENTTANVTVSSGVLRPTISGNAGVGGATLDYDGSSTTADATTGEYSFTVPFNWSGTVTPSKTGYTFTPDHRDYSALEAEQTGQDYAATRPVDVYVANPLKGIYDIVSDATSKDSYPSLLDGPVKVKDENGQPIFSSQVVLSGPGNSYNETMGYPSNQFTTDYWFPWYDHGYPSVGGDNVRTWILVGNPSASSTATVNIYIGGVLQTGSPFSIPPGNRVTPRWIGAIGGPVHVSSDIPVFASERVFTVPDDSFSEMMGYPANQFTTEYWFPWYDSINMDTSIKVGNTSSSQTANVDIYIGTTFEGSYTIPHDQTISESYASTLDGPVRVVGTNGINIVASQWTLSGSSNSFNETMGYPFNQFTTEYWFPWYDHGYPNVSGDNMRTWVLVGNPSASSTATAHIYIGGVEQSGSPFSIPAGSNVQPRWIGTIGGPVHVVSDIPVFTSERVFTVPNNSFNEMMGYPANQLTSEYWFPWYDSVNMANSLYLSRP